MAHILIIDDDADIREGLSTILTAKGYHVQTAGDGTDGLEQARNEKPDLIILDVMMNIETEGFNVSYTIRKDPVLMDIPILMLTSINQKTGFRFNPEEDGEFLPVDDFVEKPVSPETLLRKTQKLLALEKDQINKNGKKQVL
jgi:CheY-like chemotaxis protein